MKQMSADPSHHLGGRELDGWLGPDGHFSLAVLSLNGQEEREQTGGSG